MNGPKDLRFERAKFLMEHEEDLRKSRTADALNDAPLRLRRLGLPLAVATWSREGRRELISLLAEWLFRSWGALGVQAVPETAAALLQKVQDLRETQPMVSAMELEAERFLQAAKLLSGAYTGKSNER